MVKEASTWQQRNRKLLVSILDNLNQEMPERLIETTRAFKIILYVEEGHARAKIEYPPPISMLEVKE